MSESPTLRSPSTGTPAAQETSPKRHCCVRSVACASTCSQKHLENRHFYNIEGTASKMSENYCLGIYFTAIGRVVSYVDSIYASSEQMQIL